MRGLHAIDYALLTGYAILLLALGMRAFRRQAAPQEYFLAGRSAGWFTVGLSLMVSLASSLGYVAVPSAANQSGVLILWSLLALPLVYPVVTRVFIPFYQRLDVYTAYEYLERRFDLSVRLFASALFIGWRVTWMAAVLYVPAMALAVATNGAVPLGWTVGVVGLVATLYTMVGGMRGILAADVAQAVIMLGGTVLTLCAIALAFPGGGGALWSSASGAGLLGGQAIIPGWEAAGWGEKASLYFYTDFTAWAIIVSFTIGKLGNYGVDQLMIQRYMSARSEQAARRGFLFNCFILAGFFVLMTSTGIALAVYSRAADFPALRPDQIFPWYIAHHVPHGLAGLMFAGLLAAAVSSFDSGINACANAITNDFMRRLGGVNQATTAARATAIALGLCGIALATSVGSLGDIFEIALRLVNSFIGPLLAVFLLAMFSRRAAARGVLLGAITGTLATSLLVVAGLATQSLQEGTFGHALFSWLDIGFLWITPVSLCLTLGACYTLSLLCTVPGARHLCWTWRGVMSLPPQQQPEAPHKSNAVVKGLV